MPAPLPTIYYQDDDLLIAHKAANLLAVPGKDRQLPSLAEQLQRHQPNLLPVHRLDMATSGLMVFARHKQAQSALHHLFAARLVHKNYSAVVCGTPLYARGVINIPLAANWPKRPLQQVNFINGKISTTLWQLLNSFYHQQQIFSQLLLTPLSGRTHQLRLHLSTIGLPIVGDKLYGSSLLGKNCSRLLLHACRLRFTQPLSGKEIDITAPLNLTQILTSFYANSEQLS